MITIRCKSLIQRLFLLVALVSNEFGKLFFHPKRRRVHLSK